MLLQGVSIPLVLVDPLGAVRRACAADHYVLPPMSEALIDVYVDRSGDEQVDQTVLIEPVPQVTDTFGLAMASCVVNVADNTTAKIRLLNPFP